MLRVRAAGVNARDVHQRRGLCGHAAGQSPLPGVEVAGAVVAMGVAVDGSVRLGDEVCEGRLRLSLQKRFCYEVTCSCHGELRGDCPRACTPRSVPSSTVVATRSSSCCPLRK
jgi:D-arabinose 1-dehydrogenase-like Zn-dependent alcohol dehydrogenase